MSSKTSRPKKAIRQLQHHWLILVISTVFFIAYLFAKSMPRENLFLAQESTKRILKLTLGIIYLLVDGLPLIVAAILVAACVFFALWSVRSLVKQKRWPTLIPVLLLLASNFLFVGAPSLVLSRSVEERDIRCELFFSDQNGLRVIRYPLDIQRNYAEQQFFMMTFDGGKSWGQFANTFVYEPLIQRCEAIEFSDELNGTLIVEHSLDLNTTEYLTYQTTDGGQNWEIVAREQP